MILLARNWERYSRFGSMSDPGTEDPKSIIELLFLNRLKLAVRPLNHPLPVRMCNASFGVRRNTTLSKALRRRHSAGCTRCRAFWMCTLRLNGNADRLRQSTTHEEYDHVWSLHKRHDPQVMPRWWFLLFHIRWQEPTWNTNLGGMHAPSSRR